MDWVCFVYIILEELYYMAWPLLKKTSIVLNIRARPQPSVDVVVVRVVTSIVVMSWPLLLGGLLLSASPAMSGSIRHGYNMNTIPMSYPRSSQPSALPS